MKNSFHPFHPFVFGAFLAVPLLAQPDTSGRSKSAEAQSPQSLATATTTRDPAQELAQVRTRLEEIRRETPADKQAEYFLMQRVAELEKFAPSTFSVDFSGGQLERLLATVAKTNTHPFNLLAEDPQKLRDATLSAFSVHNVTPAAFAATLNLFLAPQGMVVEKIIPDQFYGGQDHPGPEVYVMRPAKSSAAAPGRFESFQLDRYLEQQSIDDIVGAVRAAWELDPAHKSDALHIKFHPATSILLVSGPEDAIRIAEQVIQSLKRPQPRPPQPTPAPSPDKK